MPLEGKEVPTCKKSQAALRLPEKDH